MHRQRHFLVFCILLLFASRNDAESLPALSDQCLEFDVVDLEEYISKLNFTNVPTVDAMFAGLECPIAALPFGFLRSDWARLSLLRNALLEDSILVQKLGRLFRIMIIAYQRIERGLIPSSYLSKSNDGHVVTTESVFHDTVTMDSTNITKINKNRGDIKENGSEQGNVLELVITENSPKTDLPKEFTTFEFLYNLTGTGSTPYVNKLTKSTSEDWTFKDHNEKIVKEAREKVDPVGSSKSSTPINVEVGRVANSRSTIKSSSFGTSTEKLNSIDSLSTSRTELSKGTALQEAESTRTTSRTINFHGSNDEGNRTIEDDRDFVFTTILPTASTVNTEASSNRRTDFNGFDTDREEIKEKNAKFTTTFFQDTSTEVSTSSTTNYYLNDIDEKVLNNDSLESVDIDENFESWGGNIFVTTAKASTSNVTISAILNEVTNRQHLEESTTSGLSTSTEDNLQIVRSVFTSTSKTITSSTNSIEGTEEFNEGFWPRRKRYYTNTKAENNFRFFYNLGEMPTQNSRKNDGSIWHLIRVQCKNES